jgi:thioredoxin-related protein
MACMAARPVVDGIEQEHQGRLVVIRLNVQDPVGREIGEQFRFRATPTFIFFDASGAEQWRTFGAVDPLEVRGSLAEP